MFPNLLLKVTERGTLEDVFDGFAEAALGGGLHDDAAVLRGGSWKFNHVHVICGC